MSIEYNIRYSNSYDIIGLSKYQDRIREHIIALIRIERTNENTNENTNERIFVNSMLNKIVSELLIQGYSPFTVLNDEYIINKLSTIRLEDIINKGFEWINRNKLCRCNIFSFCNNTFDIYNNKPIIMEIIKYYIINYGIIPSCRYMLLCYQYYLQEKRVGTTQEISDYDLLLAEIEMDPESFHQKYKHKIPTQNLSNLNTLVMTQELHKEKDPCCSICQYDIEPNQKYHELPCGHLFHKENNECLEYATIIYWLKDNKICPMCKQEVNL